MKTLVLAYALTLTNLSFAQDQDLWNGPPPSQELHCSLQYAVECGVNLPSCITCCSLTSPTIEHANLCSNVCYAVNKVRKQECDTEI